MKKQLLSRLWIGPKGNSSSEPPNHPSSLLKRWEAERDVLSRSFNETLNVIQRTGWETLAVGSMAVDEMNFFYTVGVYDTFGLPELICVGLDVNVGGRALNHAVGLMRGGRDLSAGRIEGVLGPGIEVEFRAVDPKWLHRVMLRTDWYYRGEDVPVLQLIFPDLENHFQWDKEFNDHFRQPMLAPGSPPQDLERELWDSHDLMFDKKKWKFADQPSTRVMTSVAIEENREPLTYVAPYEDGAWMFLGDSIIESGAITSRLRRIVAADSAVNELADLPTGWVAVRDKVGWPWERRREEEDKAPLVN